MLRRFTRSLVALGAFALAAAAVAAPITATDLMNIQQVADVKIASDGSFAVYTLRTIEEDGETAKGLEKYAYRTRLWMVALDDPDATPVQLTFGERSDSSPAISPDGRRLAFVRRGVGDDAKPQVWIMPLDSPGEAAPTTDLEFGATSPVWRPDGGAILVSSSIPFSKTPGVPDWDYERPNRAWRDAERAEDNGAEAHPDGDRASLHAWLERNATDGVAVAINRIAFQSELGLKGEDSFSQLFLVDLADPAAKPKQLTSGFYSHGSASFSPDGRTVAFVSQPRTGEHPDRIRRSAVFLMNADGANMRTRLDSEMWSYGSPAFTPDGRSLVYTASMQDEPIYRQSRLGITPIAGGAERGLAPDWTSHQNSPVVTAEGVYFTSPWRGATPLQMTTVDGGVAPNGSIFPGPVGVNAYDAAAGGRVVAAVTSVENPSELFVVDAPGVTPRKITNHNSAWLDERDLASAVEHWITRPDGERVQYWIMKPANLASGARAPVVLEIHGGPMAMWGPSVFSMWHEFQMLCGRGFAVVYANPRGSSGYGHEFQRGNHMNWGDGPAGDVLAALDDAIERSDWIDPDRQFVTGGSYGGYLTAWIVGHTDRFRSAVAQRGVYDLTTFYGEGNAYSLVERAMGGFPWESATRETLARESPFTYIERITTPLLITHGSNDLRTGVTQSEMMVRALKELKRPVEYVRYPGAGHELSRSGDPLQRLDRLMRIAEFFERFDTR